MPVCPNHPSEYELRSCSRCGRGFCTSCVVLLRGAYFCADCKLEELRDVLSGTAGGALEDASIRRRFGALVIDGMIETCIVYAIVLPALFGFEALKSRFGSAREDLVMSVAFGLAFSSVIAYEGLMLARRGQTLGKMALGLKVVTPDGSDISAGQAWGRTAVRLVLLGVCWPIDYLPASFDAEKRCIHDMLAKTRVVRV